MDSLPQRAEKKGDEKMKSKIIEQMENKLDIFSEMLDILEGGDIVLDMEDINTSDIETLVTILGAFFDKTKQRIIYVKSDSYTALEELFERIN